MFKTLKNLLRIIELLLLILFQGIPFDIIKCLYYKKSNHLKYIKALNNLGEKFTAFLQYSGPTFIKLGQALSTRPDLIGQVIALHLSTLQDRLAPFTLDEVHKQIVRDFGSSAAHLFNEFGNIPIAAASIAQVHKAILKNGEIVAVKILRPNIEKRFNADIELFSQLVKFAEYHFKDNVRRLNLSEILTTLLKWTKFELDLRCEAAAADELRANLKNDPYVKIPKVYWQMVSKNILTTEWVEGISIDDYQALVLNGHDPHKLALNLTVTFFNQAFRDGFFHADLHPGNIFVDSKGQIVLVDFGIIGLLNKSDRIYVAEILYGFIKRDYKRVANIHFEAGYVPIDKDRKLFELACRSIGEPIIGLPANQISAATLLKQLFEITKQFNMPAQPQLLLLQKTMVTIEGIGQIIYPEVNMWQLADPWIKKWAKSNFGLKAKVSKALENSNDFLNDLPKIFNDAKNAIKLINAVNINKLNHQNSHTYSCIKSHKPYKYPALAFLAGGIIVAIVNFFML